METKAAAQVTPVHPAPCQAIALSWSQQMPAPPSTLPCQHSHRPWYLSHWSPTCDKAGTPTERQGLLQPPAWKHPCNGTGISQNSSSLLALGRLPEVQGSPKDESAMTGFKYPVLLNIPFFNKCINSSIPLDLCIQGKLPGWSACPENMGQHGQSSRTQSSLTALPGPGEGALCSHCWGQCQGSHTPATPPSPAGQHLPEQVTSNHLQQMQGFCVAEENRNHLHNTCFLWEYTDISGPE